MLAIRRAFEQCAAQPRSEERVEPQKGIQSNACEKQRQRRPEPPPMRPIGVILLGFSPGGRDCNGGQSRGSPTGGRRDVKSRPFMEHAGHCGSA